MSKYIFHTTLRRSLRGRDVTKFHVQLFLALLGLCLSFVVGIQRTETEILCTLSSIVILYFILASLFWMGAEAVVMFKKLVVVFGSVSSKFVITLSLTCWCESSHLAIIYKYTVLWIPQKLNLCLQ